ncbi:uncharacterized protein [Aegilops tauschii subsp. strangulata]|uniref:DUF1618 domain-containing protein n=1 Tax=Aegilops tauschii subsp. strangulata TaxID=200361 RepID=A0A453DW92_AEGTS|nr:uncharacterized protein LOC123497531 [Aegilops tauschii subsp. strangulata]
MARSTFSLHPSTLMGSSAARSDYPRSEFPDWVLLCEEPRFSELRNETTAECETSDGQTVEVSFWLVAPPGASYFSFNCPGLDASAFDDYAPPSLVCAGAAFVLFSLTIRGSTHHFVYKAGPAGKQSLEALPDPPVSRRRRFGLLPRGDGEHFAVAYLDRQWISQDDDWRFDAHVYSSETHEWSSHRLSPPLQAHWAGLICYVASSSFATCSTVVILSSNSSRSLNQGLTFSTRMAALTAPPSIIATWPAVMISSSSSR